MPKFSSVAIEQILARNQVAIALTCPAQSSPVPAFRYSVFINLAINILEPIGGSAPKFVSGATENLVKQQLHSVSLTCSAQASPTPNFRYLELVTGFPAFQHSSL